MFESLQPVCYGVVSTFFALSSITILLRFYARQYIIRNFGWDDWCMVAVFVFHCGQQSILYYFIHFGGGLHTDVVLQNHPEWIQKLTYALFVEELYYVWMHWIIKMAFLLFYLRFATKLFRTLVYYTIGLNTIFTIVQWLIYCLQCVPLDTFFHRAAHPTVKCLDNSILAFVPAALTIFTDICIVVLPINSLWRIQVNLSKRLMLIGLICLGGVVVLISLLRLTVLLEFQKMTDFTYSLGKIIIISSIELEVAIMAANAPALKVIFIKYFGSSSNEGVYAEKHSLSNYSKSRRNATPLSTCRITGNCSPGADGRRGEDALNKDDSSSEEILKYDSDGGIFVTSSVAIERQDARSSQGDGTYSSSHIV